MSWLLQFQASSLLMTAAGSRRWLEDLGPCHPPGRPGCSLAQPQHGGHLGSDQGRGASSHKLSPSPLCCPFRDRNMERVHGGHVSRKPREDLKVIAPEFSSSLGCPFRGYRVQLRGWITDAALSILCLVRALSLQWREPKPGCPQHVQG